MNGDERVKRAKEYIQACAKEDLDVLEQKALEVVGEDLGLFLQAYGDMVVSRNPELAGGLILLGFMLAKNEEKQTGWGQQNYFNIKKASA